jgi:uncharacterized protein YfaS (alpha-2-macroglobulin family)
VISKDFQIDEDPRVVDVLPNDNSVAEENSAITIVFNRPMVPLTALSVLESRDIPVEILPKTEGKFKWISTRTLQFIPAGHLAYSANYTVKILSGFKSTDGVPVPPAVYKFTTRPLNFERVTGGKIIYSEPIQIHFNEPVDLEATSRNITLKNFSTNASEPFIAEYAKSYDYDTNGKPKSVVIDRSTISVFPKNDSNGRERIWNFGGSYGLTLTKTIPLGGDINYEKGISTIVEVTEAVKSVDATAQRGVGAFSPKLFDPEGNLVIEFYEGINLDKSSIDIPSVKKISYAQVCKKEKDGSYKVGEDESTCEKEDDNTKIVIQFRAEDLKKGQEIPVTFKKVVNESGLTINSKPIVVNVSVYPELKVFSTTPSDESVGASTNYLILCTNSPLHPNKLTGKKAVETNDYFVGGTWSYPYLKDQYSYNYSGIKDNCLPGQYVNTMRYGIHPNKKYDLNLNLVDFFGQTTKIQLSFKTQSIENLDARFFSLQKVYNVTTPDKTKFTFGTENLEYVNMLICKVSPSTMVNYLDRRVNNLYPDSSLECTSRVTKRIELPKVYWVNNYFQIDLKDYVSNPLGQYIISFSNPNYVSGRKGVGDTAPLYDRTYVSVTNLAVSEKKTQWTKYDENDDLTEDTFKKLGNVANLYWVVNAKTLAPVESATVKVYKQTGSYGAGSLVAGESGVTGADGVAKLPLSKDIAGAVITSGDDSAIISSWSDNLQWAGTSQTGRLIYLYTDRPIYKPGQDVYFKGVDRFTYDGNFQIIKNRTVPIKIYDSSNTVIYESNLNLNEFGTFGSHIKLGDKIPLGTYRVQADNNYFYFDVAEYEASAFEASASSAKDEYIAGETIDVSALAKYYFGVPVMGATLNYSWTSQDYYFDKYNDEYFHFGRDWYYCQNCGYGDKYLSSGKTSVDMTGKASVSLNLDFDKLFKNVKEKRSQILVFHGTVTDANGKSVSFQKSFIVHRAEFYLGVKSEPYFSPTNSDVKIKVKTVDTKGTPVSVRSVKLKASKVEWKSAKRQEVDGGYYNKYERVLTEVSQKVLNTDRSGNGDANFQFKDSGEYEISAIAEDQKGNVVISDSSIYVYGDGNASVMPSNNETLDITTEKTDLNIGDRAKIIIKSPYKKAKAMITIERGQIFQYEIVDVNSSFYEYSFDVKDSYIPNIYVSVVLLSPNPEIKFGQAKFTVNASHRELKVSVIPEKTSYLPGEKVTLNIKTTDFSGKPQSADVSISVADLSVLALKGNPKKSPLVFFYGGLPLTVSTASNVKNILHEAEIPTGTKGGDGAVASDLAKKKRGEFKDTAFWQGSVITNENGLASVTFTLPDNLTRWQIESVGVTKDTKIGVDYKELTASKKLMLVPLNPRFVIPGDEFVIGANVFNQTEYSQTLSVALDNTTLDIQGDISQSIFLKSGESKTVYFKVSAPTDIDSGAHKFVLSVKNKDYEDTVEKTMPIKRNETYENTATAGSTKLNSVSEYVFVPEGVVGNQGGVTLRAQSSPAFFLKDAISYLAQFPYGCSEQMASKLSMLAVLKRANSVGVQFEIPKVDFEGVTYEIDDAVKIGLSRIYENQNADGGFSYYQSYGNSDVSLSIHILNTLVSLRNAGFNVPSYVISSTANYISKNGRSVYDKNTNFSKISNVDLSIESALSVVNSGAGDSSLLVQEIGREVTDSYLNDKISTSALLSLEALSQKVSSLSYLKDKVWKSINNRLSVDSRGTYLKSNPNNIRWEYYETPIRNTAQYLKLISTLEKDSSQKDNVLRWILANRDSQGAWEGTNSTLAVIDSVVSYLEWTKEASSEFTLKTSLDNVEFAKYDFVGKAKMSSFEKFLSIDKFPINTNHKITFEKVNGTGPASIYYDMSLKYYLPAEQIEPRDEGIAVFRNYYSINDTKYEKPISEAKVGEVLRGRIKFVTAKPRSLFAVESYIPAGLELVDFNLATEDKTQFESDNKGLGVKNENSESGSSLSLKLLSAVGASSDKSLPEVYIEDLRKSENTRNYYPEKKEIHDDRLFLFTSHLAPGEYTYDYYVKVSTAGTFRQLPTVASELYFPEVFGRTEGGLFTVKQ